MLDQYGNDYLYDNVNGEGIVDSMDMFEEHIENMNGYDAFMAALFAYEYDGKDDWEGHQRSFSLNDDWFAIDAYGHYVSMNNNERMEWYNRSIDDNYFIDWLIENGYVEGGIEE